VSRHSNKNRPEHRHSSGGASTAPYLGIAMLFFVLISSAHAAVVAAGASDVATWHVREAQRRYRIVRDDRYVRMPDVSLLDIPFAEGSSPKEKFRYDRKSRSRYFRLGARMYYDGIGVYSDATAVYEVKPRYGRFVALVGVDDRLDSGESAVVEVQADSRTIYKSPVLRARTNPLVINVAIPRGTKQLKLITRDFKAGGSRRTVDWVNAGFIHTGSTYGVSYVDIPTGQEDAAGYDAVVVTRSGRTVPNRIVSQPSEKSLRLFFDSTRGGEWYYVYLVPKAARKTTTGPWRPEAGLILETRYTNSLDPKNAELNDLIEAWRSASPVGWSLVNGIFNAYPIHRLPGGDKTLSGRKTLALYRYTGYFNVDEAGDYTFATNSLWGSWVLVDDRPVVGWPGTHSNRDGRRGEKQADITLRPGIHKIEYLNFSEPAKMFTTAAWKRPEGKLRIMEGRDFLPVERWRAGHVASLLSSSGAAIFQWRVTDDVRPVETKSALIQIEFEALDIEGQSDLSFNWDFGDGISASGRRLRHVFAGPGPRQVTLSILKNGRTLATTTQTVNVHLMWEKAFANLFNVRPFEEALVKGGLDRLVLKDLVCVFDFADAMDRQTLKKQAAFAMAARATEAASEEGLRKTYLKASRYLRGPWIKRYDLARQILFALAAGSKAGSSTYADILLDKKRLGGLSDTQKRRLLRIRLETSAGTGSVGQVNDLLARNARPAPGKDARLKRLRHAGYLNHARQLLEHKDDPLQLGYAMEKIEDILADDPARVFDSELNLVRLDIHLARKEYSIAFHLAERLDKLDLSEYHRPLIILRKIRALSGLKDIARCREAYRRLADDYPASAVLEPSSKRQGNASSRRLFPTGRSGGNDHTGLARAVRSWQAALFALAG